MERVRLTPPGHTEARGERARLYVRWMPHLGAEAIALYELLRILPDIGHDEADAEELSELLRSTPEGVEVALETLKDAGFVLEREGWLEVAEHPPAARKSAGVTEAAAAEPDAEADDDGGASDADDQDNKDSVDIEIVRAEPEGVTPDDYFKFMGSLPSPHILEFLNGYCERDSISPDVVREALKIASERDARKVGYVRSILERWVERGVKTAGDVERFEKDRRLRLVEESGAVKGGALNIGQEVRGGAHRRSAARSREDYEWFFGE